MTPDDRAAAQSWQPAIAQSAQFFGYTLDSSYTYREIACPVAPRHLLLAYEAASANGSISRFTAIVGRGAEEETAGSHPVAQIIPILHFGIVPFIPAIANPHSIEVFNAAISPAPSATEVLSAAQAGNQPLLLRSLCYLAMVGEEPASLGPSSADQATIHAPVPTLVFQNKGKIRQQISIRSSQNSYQVWALTFQSGGKLLAATRQEHPIDRTPLVLNAANNGSPAGSTGATTISTGAAQISSPALAPTPMPPPAATASAAIAPAAAESTPTEVAAPTPATAAAAAIPAPPVPPANPPAVVASTPVAPSVVATPADTAKVERPQPAPLPPPAETPAPITEPVSTPVSAPATSTVEPVSPATPAMAEPPPPQPAPLSAPTPPKPVAAVSTPQPLSPPAAPAPTAAAAHTANSVPPAPAVAFAATAPVVKPSLPMPPGRFIPNPPQPPSRFIPDSALKTPPHLPQ